MGVVALECERCGSRSLSYDSHASRMEKRSMWGAIMQAAEVGLKAVFISA
jgi:hypothetical protein